MKPDANGTWCDPVDPSVTHFPNEWYQVAVCLTSAPSSTGGFQFDVVYNHALNTCLPVTTGSFLDQNPDANAKATGGTVFDGTVSAHPNGLGTGWNCNLGDVAPPTCSNLSGNAFLQCNTVTGTLELPAGANTSEPIAVLTFTAAAVGVDNLALSNVSVYDVDTNEFVTCANPTYTCIGGTNESSGPSATPTPTNTPTPTATPCPDSDCDLVLDEVDNCPFVYNPDQLNSDGGPRPAGPRIPSGWASNPAADKLGDACDPDNDNDALPDAQESDFSCPYRLKADSDGDNVLDGFEVATEYDPCSAASKPVWEGGLDSDGDGLQDGLERSGYNTCAFAGDTVPGYTSCAAPTDSDNDGCADTLEVMDINGDRKVTVGDQTLLAKRGAGLIPPHAVSDRIFDVNKDGQISVGDQTLMAKNTCNLKPGLVGCPVCPPE